MYFLFIYLNKIAAHSLSYRRHAARITRPVHAPRPAGPAPELRGRGGAAGRVRERCRLRGLLRALDRVVVRGVVRDAVRRERVRVHRALGASSGPAVERGEPLGRLALPLPQPQRPSKQD